MIDQVGNGPNGYRSPGDEDKGKQAEEDSSPQLGVLFVHGIGEQRRGDTLPWAGDALFKWYRLWSCKGNIQSGLRTTPYEPYLADTRLARPLPSELDAPPFSHMKFQTTNHEVAERDQEWVLAESWWASEFTPPTYAEMVVLGLSIAPWLIEQTGLRIIGDILRVVRNNAVRAKPANQSREAAPPGKPRRFLGKALAWTGDRLLDVAGAITWVVGGFLLLTVGVLAQALILALWFLALIPPLRDPVVKLQLGLTGWLGDGYLMATSPVRFSAMVSQVRRDVDWLASMDKGKGRCRAVAVVAHSGGAVVAHEALTGPGSPKGNILLVTYGSGQSKVDSISKLRNDRTPFFRFGPFFRIAGVFFSLAALYLGVQKDPNVASWLVLLFGVAGVGISLTFWFVGARVARNMDALRRFRPPAPAGREWIDYRAVADVVPDDPIFSADDGVVRLQTERSNNQHSILKDHSWYWHNDEEFLAEVARLLHAKATTKDLATDEEKEVLARGQARRKDRVLSYLTACLLVMLSVPILWLDLGPWLGQWVGEPVGRLLVGILTLSQVTGANKEWTNLLGVLFASVVASALVITFVLSPLWAHWCRGEEMAMFRRARYKVAGHSRGARAGLGILGELLLFPLWNGWSKCEELAWSKQNRPREYKDWHRAAVWYLRATIVIPAAVFITALVETFYFNRGFPEGVNAVQAFIGAIVGMVPGDAGTQAALWTENSTAIHTLLVGIFLIIAGLVCVSSIVNAMWAWRASLLGPFTTERPVFYRLLTQLTAKPGGSEQVSDAVQDTVQNTVPGFVNENVRVEEAGIRSAASSMSANTA